MRRRVKKRSVETLVLFRNKHTCCVCRDYRDYQEPILHHIDGDPSNTTEANLAVLCLNHASMADAGLHKGKIGAGRKLSPKELSAYKKSWEEKVLAEINIERRQTTVRHRKELKVLFEFEIRRIKNEILMLRDVKEVSRRYDFLTQLFFEEIFSGLPLRKLVLDAYSDIAMLALGDKSRSLPLLKALPDLFLHLVGPEKVPLYEDDKRYLMKTIDILENIGSFGALVSDDREVLKRTCKSILEFVDIASWYDFKKFIRAAMTIMRKIKKDCSDYSNQSALSTKKERVVRTKMVDDFLKKIKGKLRK